MADFVPDERSIRQRALEALVERLRTQRAHLPVGDPYGFAWDQVLWAPAGKWTFKKQRSIGVFDGHETKTNRLMVKQCVLRVALEVALVIQSGEGPSAEMNRVFGALQRRVSEDPSLGGLVIDLQEVGNDHKVSDDNQTHVRGVVHLDMTYRHAVQDPRRLA
ncbi:MAG: hypothetical protein AB7F22_25395 [Reyranella sp.]|uniref:hypothetical protein n=2 Tax=Reyranella sp. TaxID=1929291 RepID=UPI003D0FE786